MPSYTTVDRVLALVPAIGSLSAVSQGGLTSAQILSAFIEPTEALINAKLARLYAVPVVGAPVLGLIADEMTCYRILSRRVFTQEKLKDSVWPTRFKESMDLLNELATGETLLVNSAGTAPTGATGTVALAESNKTRYLPTFREDDPIHSEIDPNLLDDIETERDNA